MVREGADLTRFPGIGEGIAAAVREIVLTGSTRQARKAARTGGARAGRSQRLSPPRPQARDARLQEAGHRLRGGTERAARER